MQMDRPLRDRRDRGPPNPASSLCPSFTSHTSREDPGRKGLWAQPSSREAIRGRPPLYHATRGRPRG